MAKLGIIGGTGLFHAKAFSEAKWEVVKTEYGEVRILDRSPVILLQRHGSPPLPPHAINHRANIAALEEEGVTRIVAFNSVGSMKPALKPGTFVLPDDFISPWDIPTFYDQECHFTFCPQIDPQLQVLLGAVLKKLGIPHVGKGTYLQTRGPRFETKAEIRMFSKFADIIGMTLGSEATLAAEAEIPLAAVCAVDNYANGIRGTVREAELEMRRSENVLHIDRILGALLGGKW
ncbi:MAG TPA: MTAP family purine nucleoside phosphorylase [Candidatus Nanoarchaeia archaeon]|nr:MTAP family purine nucleoside phosphorylase [Candidatus Nanoarchaeia archaeon]